MRIILFGAPGSGKGTQAVMLSSYFNIKRISLGDILRDEAKKSTVLGREVKGYMEKGVLAPDELVAHLIDENLDSEEFILDGFPRNINQAARLEEILHKKNSSIDAFIYLDVDEDTVLNRLSKRRVCIKCGANYHLNNMPPKTDKICDICGGELVRREDDAPEVIKKRWEVFLKESGKLLDFYAEKNKLIKVDANLSKEEVFEKIKDTIQCYSH
jgi:adenylate kinase